MATSAATSTRSPPDRMRRVAERIGRAVGIGYRE